MVMARIPLDPPKTDAALLTSPRFQRQLAAALLAAILTFLGK